LRAAEPIAAYGCVTMALPYVCSAEKCATSVCAVAVCGVARLVRTMGCLPVHS
jgi:hypothetical protein